jgi:LysR family hydrogen peroxide-inducible transcriptional activator
MELHQLRYFVAVAEAGSISRAAERCQVAQPSLSQQIKRLEENLGHQLFDRTARGTSLTEAGRVLLPRARRILSEVRATQETLGHDIATGKGHLSIGAISTMAPYLLPPVLGRFVHEFPHCELTLYDDLTDHLVEALIDGEIDCALVSTPIFSDLVEIEVIGSERLLVVCAGDDPFDAPPRLEDLEDLPAVVLHEMHCLGEQIQGFCSAHRVHPRHVCRSTQLSTVQHLVSLGLGVSIVPEMAARADAASNRRYLPIRGQGPSREIAVAWRRGRTRTYLAQQFIHMVHEDLVGGVHRFEG